MAKITVELRPFNVPNFVLQIVPPGKRQDGIKEAPSYPLSSLDVDILSEMCDEFRAEIFKKAGNKADPRMEEG